MALSKFKFEDSSAAAKYSIVGESSQKPASHKKPKARDIQKYGTKALAREALRRAEVTPPTPPSSPLLSRSSSPALPAHNIVVTDEKGVATVNPHHATVEVKADPRESTASVLSSLSAAVQDSNPLSMPPAEAKVASPVVVSDEKTRLLALLGEAKKVNPGKETNETALKIVAWEGAVASGALNSAQLRVAAESYSVERSSFFRGASWSSFNFSLFAGKPAIDAILAGTSPAPAAAAASASIALKGGPR